MGKRHLFMMIVFKHFLRKKITKMKRYRNLALVNFMHYGKMKKLFTSMNLNQLFFLRISFRQIWALERREFWFSNLWERRNDEKCITLRRQWKDDFRMSRQTFKSIVEVVRPRLQKQNTQLRNTIPIEKRVAVAIWRLATGDSYRAVGGTFGIGKSTAVSITHDFYKELSRISRTFIRFLKSRSETRSAIRDFKEETNCKTPQALGAIDCIHIKILPPANEDKKDYFSQKQSHTINTQAVTGANLKTYDLAMGLPGSIHDARALRKTSIYRKAENNEILSHPLGQINDVNVRPLILEYGANPLFPWLVKPYPQGPALTVVAKVFNRKVSSTRVVAEKAFGVFKASWRFLLKRIDTEIANVFDQIIACSVLHNIFQENGEEFINMDGVLAKILRNEREARRRAPQVYNVFHDGEEIRTQLKLYVQQNN